MLRIGLVLASLLFGAQAAVFQEEKTSLPVNWTDNEVLPQAKAVDEHAAMVVEGINHHDEPRIVILRFDDKRSDGYHSRLNVERPVRPGPFSLHLPLTGLKTPDKRPFDWSSWRGLYVFADKAARHIEVSRVAIENAAPFSDASYGFDLGSKSSPVMTGMTKINKGFPGLVGKHLRARHAASGDALLSDGIEGIERLLLPLPNGRWHITLYHAMPGEWENLPRQLSRHIRLQGKTVLQQQWDAVKWLQDVYLAGQNDEAVFDGNLWSLHGDRKGQSISAEVKVSDGLLRIEMLGATTHDNYLAGVFATPVELAGSDLTQLHKTVRRRFEQQWPVVNESAMKASFLWCSCGARGGISARLAA